MKKSLLVVSLMALTTTITGCASKNSDGAGYPERRIEYTVPFGPGGGTDLISRKVAALAEDKLGQQIVIVNKEGGAGSIGPGEVSRSKPDGYTIGLSNNQSSVFTPMTTDLPYNGPEDYQPIVKLSELPCVLVVAEDSKYSTFEDFINAKGDPLHIGVAGKLTACDLSWQGQVAKEVGSSATTVPFTGGAGEAATALLGGKTDAFLGDLVAVLPQLKAGKMRALVVMQDKPHPLLKDVPTITEAGYDDVLPITYFVMGPKGLPTDVRDKLVDAFTTALKSDEFQTWASENGYLLDPKGPDELLAELQEQRPRYEAIAKELGIK